MSLIVIHLLLHVFMGGQIAWQAHLGGFVAGYFLCLYLLMVVVFLLTNVSSPRGSDF